MKMKYFTPLVLFIVPTVIISAIMWPPAAMQAKLIGGFTVMILSMVLTYFYGIRVVLDDRYRPGHEIEN